MRLRAKFAALSCAVAAVVAPAQAASIIDTGPPDGRIAMKSGGTSGTQAADDFSAENHISINAGSFTGLVTGGLADASSITDVSLLIFRIFPADSANPPDGSVPARVNSPADNALVSASSALSQVSFTASILSDNFVAANSVSDSGIHEFPNQRTGGNGAIAGQELQINFTLNSSFALDAGIIFLCRSSTCQTAAISTGCPPASLRRLTWRSGCAIWHYHPIGCVLEPTLSARERHTMPVFL